VAVPLTPGFAPAPAALIDRDQMLIVESREGDPELVAVGREAEASEVEGGVVAAEPGRKGKRAQYRCTVCGYGIVVYGQSPSCPMCRETRWEHVEWRPFSLLDGIALPSGTRSQRRPLHPPSSPTAEESIRYLRPGQAVASLKK
jgi:hypothetical protein